MRNHRNKPPHQIGWVVTCKSNTFSNNGLQPVACDSFSPLSSVHGESNLPLRRFYHSIFFQLYILRRAECEQGRVELEKTSCAYTHNSLRRKVSEVRKDGERFPFSTYVDSNFSFHAEKSNAKTTPHTHSGIEFPC